MDIANTNTFTCVITVAILLAFSIHIAAYVYKYVHTVHREVEIMMDDLCTNYACTWVPWCDATRPAGICTESDNIMPMPMHAFTITVFLP